MVQGASASIAAMALLVTQASAYHSVTTASDRSAPQIWAHEPGKGDRLDRFQVILVDDHSCPTGQIKKFTAGSNSLGVRSTRECIAR